MDYFHNAWMEDGVICFSDHSCFAPPPFPYPYVHHPNPPPWPYPTPPHSPPPAIWRSQPFPSPPRRVTVIIPVSGAEKSFEINTGSAADSPVAAAVRIQKAYRGFLVRRDLRTISQAAAEFNEVRDFIVSEVDKIRFDPLERLRLIEMLKKLVLRLSTVHISRDNQRMHFRRMLVIIAIGLKNLVNSLAEQSPVLSNEHSIIAWGNFESLLLEVADYPVTDADYFGAKRSYIKIEEAHGRLNDPPFGKKKIEEAPQAEEIERETSIASSGDGFEVLGYTMVEHEDDDESLDGEFLSLSKDDFPDSYLTDMKTEVKTLDIGAAAAENERRRSSGMPACVIVSPIADEAEPVPTILDDNYMSTYQVDKFAENEHSKPISGMPASVGVPPIVDEGEPVPTKQAVDAVNSAETAEKGMEQLVADLCESYLKQSRLVNRLTERIEHLEQMMQSMKK